MKAILVVDVPTEMSNDYTCVTITSLNSGISFNAKLKPMPQKKNEKDVEKVYSTNDRSWTNGFSDGYNYCIDELLGETV